MRNRFQPGLSLRLSNWAQAGAAEGEAASDGSQRRQSDRGQPRDRRGRCGDGGRAAVRLSDPLNPRVAGVLDPVPPLLYAHDMVALPNGNVLVGYLRSDGPSPVGGLTSEAMSVGCTRCRRSG